MLKFERVNSFFFVVVLLVYTFEVPKFLYFFIFLVWLVITIIGSFHIRWNYHLKALHSNPHTNKKQVAITFDDGPNLEFTPQILTFLKKHNIKATFFCVGKQIENHPKLFNQIVNQGHVVGNHSYSHSNNFGFFSHKKVLDDVNKCNELIYENLNVNSNLFRPPFGVTNPAIRKAIAKTRHHVIGWSVRSLDTKIKNPEKILKRITKRLKPGDVILLHDTNKRTLVVLEQLLLFLHEHQFETTTVDKLFEIEAYV